MVIPNDIPKSIFAGPLPVMGVWGQYPIYLAESPVHLKRVKQLSGRTAEDICLAAGLCSGPILEYLQRSPADPWLVEGRCPFHRNQYPAHGRSGLRLVDQRLLYNKPGIPSRTA